MAKTKRLRLPTTTTEPTPAPSESGLILPFKRGDKELRKLVMREVPKEWEAQLNEISPQNNRFSWLKLIWEEGHPWEPVERYLIYQMVPAHAIIDEIHEQLRDFPPPSKMGNYYDTVKQEFVRNPDCLITERAWHLYQETKCWGRPFWVIQGDNGGHKRWFSANEKKFLKMAGLPTDPPPPGDLPYAPFDDRVIKQLMVWDLMKGQHGGLRRSKKLLQGAYSKRYEEDERAFRELMVKWLAEQVTEASEGVMESLMKLDAPRADVDVKELERRDEQGIQNFIETGKSHGGAILRPS